MHLAYLSDAMYGSVLGGGLAAALAPPRVPAAAGEAVAAVTITAHTSALTQRGTTSVVHRDRRPGSSL